MTATATLRLARDVAGTAWSKLTALATPASTLVVPVLDAEPAVAAWLGKRHVEFDGAPLHVTTMYPFLPARSITEADRAEIAKLAAATAPFAFSLTHLDRFPGVLYLAPRPAESFVALTEKVMRRWPACLPYGGVYESIVPHMTVAFDGAEQAPQPDPTELSDELPIQTVATEMWLLEQTVRGWRRAERFAFGGTANTG